MKNSALNRLFARLNTPQKVQDFLDKVPFNFEEEEETYRSPQLALKAGKMHCFEGALFACLCLERHGFKSYLLDLKVKDLKKDSDHTLCIFKLGRHWGAISKTNHSVLRWRDPIYQSPRELSLSFFHEYFIETGEKTLKSFSKPFDVFKKFGHGWAQAEEDLDEIAEALDASEHIDFVPQANSKLIRKAGPTEVRGAAVTEWKRNRKMLK